MSVLVKVVVPIYRKVLPKPEQEALLNNVSKLSRYPIVLLAPEGLDIQSVEKLVPKAEVVRVSEEWIGSKNGIAGYNTMMMSERFYQLFSDADYILICHTDAWIFNDDLEAWCKKGYDCVAAPWIRRKRYNMPIIKQYMAFMRWMAHKQGKLSRQMIYGKIGNGGLSLRKVSSFAQECKSQTDLIRKYLSACSHVYNEDVFWAIEPQGFSYPTEKEALAFAFDTKPSYCYRLRNRELPMGCHGWNKPNLYRFWKTFIPIDLVK